MTKQQQEAYTKFQKALELQEQGIPRHEIYSIVGYASLDSLTKVMRKNGYTYSKQEEKYINNSNTECNTFCITPVKIIETPKNEIQVIERSEVIELIEDEKETLKELLEWFKAYRNTGNTSNTLIKIELPESENIMISARSNRVVWDRFKNFAKKNSAHFTLGDLVAQALLDYMKKYE